MTLAGPVLLKISAWLLFGGFAGYFAASILYMAGVIGKRLSHGRDFQASARWALVAHGVGVLLHALAIVTRWQGSGYWPTSNMYEFIGFMAFTSMLAFQIINWIYRLPVLGALISPVGVFLVAYAYVFPPKVVPLIPALKSYWLPVHVSLAALGEGFFAIAFGAALLYLLRIRGLELAAAGTESGGETAAAGSTVGIWEHRWGLRATEVLFYLILVMVGFTLLALGLRYSGFQWIFDATTYHLPPIIGPLGEAIGSKGELFGLIPMPLVAAPAWIQGKNLNTMLYSLVVGGVLYGVLRRVVTREPIGDFLARRVTGDLEIMDEISYRAVAIGYPIFTLGGLVFAMLWAKEAWGRYWFWDPKETWAFIAWLVYSAYLHLRITWGWEGRRSAWVAVLGFGIILFTLVGVNLLIVGLHSYAGGDL